MEYCRERGATVITLVGHGDSPLGQGGDHVFVNFAEDDTSSELFDLQSLLIALSIMRHRGEFDGYGSFVADVQRLPEALLAVKREVRPGSRGPRRAH